jgi:hypothetical protein
MKKKVAAASANHPDWQFLVKRNKRPREAAQSKGLENLVRVGLICFEFYGYRGESGMKRAVLFLAIGIFIGATITTTNRDLSPIRKALALCVIATSAREEKGCRLAHSSPEGNPISGD